MTQLTHTTTSWRLTSIIFRPKNKCCCFSEVGANIWKPGDNWPERPTTASSATSSKHRGWFHFKAHCLSLSSPAFSVLALFLSVILVLVVPIPIIQASISAWPVFLTSKIISAIFAISGHFKFNDGSQGKPYLGLYQISSLQAGPLFGLGRVIH